VDPDGHDDIARVHFFLDRQPPIASGGLAAAYLRPANILWLKGGGICRPGQTRFLSTDNATLDCVHTTVSGDGDTLTINWHVRPERCFDDSCGWNSAYGLVSDSAGLRDLKMVGWWRLAETGG